MSVASVPVLAAVATAMALATGYLLRYVVEARGRGGHGVGLFLLAMMGEMWVSAVLYLSAPSAGRLVIALAVSGGLMVATAAPLLLVLLRPVPPRRLDAGSGIGRPPSLGLLGAAVVAGLVLVNEFLMGWGLLLASGTAASAIGSGGAAGVIAHVVDSPWFLFSMAGEMAVTALLLGSRLPVPVRAILLAQAAIMVFSPPALASAMWSSLALYVSSGVMIGLFVYVFEYLYRNRQLSRGLSAYLVGMLAAYAGMMLGLFAWSYFGSAPTFAVSVIVEMAVFYGAVSLPRAFSGPVGAPWTERPNWTFAVLSLIFVAEVAMGAVLSLNLDPADYVGGYPFLALAGPPAAVVVNALLNTFWFLATSVASTWFLVMMGLEMGVLVAFKYRETRHLENRVRLLLMMGSYAAFAVFYPSLYFGLVFPNAANPSTVPVLGWSMGIGSYPLAFGVFGTLLATYVITGALVVLFGRRVVCSVFCTAPLMYQGTTIDAMKSFNRSEPVARKYLSSRFSGAYSVTTGLMMTALVGTSLLSYLNTVGVTHAYVLGTDPSVFLFVASFSIAWYVLFVSIPYAGNYNCVTMGWCYTGTITQAFQKVGFFKLKVRDKQVCRDCTTLDCAKGCPIGLVDMPGHFRQTGEFRSTKCCGVGECMEACPYDNIYISDVRHWVRRRLGLPEVGPRRTGPGFAAAGVHPAAPAARALPVGAMPLPMAGEPRASSGG